MAALSLVPPAIGSSRLVGLDFLRGIAILLVLGHHQVLEEAGPLDAVRKAWYLVGWTGVDLFFVLSGLLVGGLLMAEIQKHGALDVKRFMIRRGFKIWPSYYVFLLASFAYLVIAGGLPPGTAARLLGPSLAHMQNYVDVDGAYATGPSVMRLGLRLGHTWSLAVEEHFYLLLPLGLFLAVKAGPSTLKTWFPRVVLVIFVVSLGLRCLNYGHVYRGWTHYTPTHLRLDSVFFGALLAYCSRFATQVWRPLSRHPGRMLFAGLVYLAPTLFFFRDRPVMYTIGFTLIYLGYGCIIIAVLTWSLRPATKWFFETIPARAVSVIGVYSYSVYLWHLKLGQALPLAFVRRGWLSSVPATRWIVVQLLYIVCVTVAGMVTARIIEFPAIALRDRFFPTRAPTALPPEAAAAAARGEGVPRWEVAAYQLPALPKFSMRPPGMSMRPPGASLRPPGASWRPPGGSFRPRKPGEPPKTGE